MKDPHPKERFITFLTTLEHELDSLDEDKLSRRNKKKITRSKTLIAGIIELLQKFPPNHLQLFKKYRELKIKILYLTKKKILKKEWEENLIAMDDLERRVERESISLSRRNFTKAAAAGTIGLGLAPGLVAKAFAQETQKKPPKAITLISNAKYDIFTTIIASQHVNLLKPGFVGSATHNPLEPISERSLSASNNFYPPCIPTEPLLSVLWRYLQEEKGESISRLFDLQERGIDLIAMSRQFNCKKFIFIHEGRGLDISKKSIPLIEEALSHYEIQVYAYIYYPPGWWISEDVKIRYNAFAKEYHIRQGNYLRRGYSRLGKPYTKEDLEKEIKDLNEEFVRVIKRWKR